MVQRINISLTDETAERLRRYALLTTKKMRGTSEIVERALVKFLDEVEEAGENEGKSIKGSKKS